MPLVEVIRGKQTSDATIVTATAWAGATVYALGDRRTNGGKVPPIPRHGGSPAVEDEAFKLKQGELSGIVSVDNQFIILRCLGRTKPVQVDINSIQDELAKEIEEKMKKILLLI